MALRISLDGNRALIAKLGRISPAIEDKGARALAVIGNELATWAKTHYPESGLHVRSGDLRNSIAPMPVEKTPHGLRGGMLAGQGLPYAPAQEFGAHILPVNAQFLTIPLDEALTPSGVARFDARGAEAAGYKTFVRNKIIFGVKDGILYPLFYLADEVTIPARSFAGPSLPANRDMIERTLKQAVSEGIREA